MRPLFIYWIIGLFGYWLIGLFPSPMYAQSPAPVDPFTIGKRTFTDPPRIAIALPEDKSTIFGSTVTIRTIVDNLILTNPERKKVNEKGEGHLLFWIDTQDFDRETAITHYLLTDFTLTDVSPGDHTLTTELVQNDGKSLTPPVRHTITFTTLAAPTPMVSIPSTITAVPSQGISRETLGRIIATTTAAALILAGGILYKMK